MEGEFEISKKQQELIDIIISIISTLKKIKKEKAKISFEFVKKINSFNVEDEDKELKHFAFFVKHLFLGENGSSDFDYTKLQKLLSENMVKAIFDSLIECIESNNFLDFLLKLGEKFSKVYFINDSIGKLVDKYQNSGISNYEVLFHIFSMCKKSKVNKYICENYDIYYSETYSKIIAYNLIIANNAYIKLIISSPNFDNLSDFISDEDNITDSSRDKAIRINEIENYIYKSLITFWCNSLFFYSDNLQDFVSHFYSFLMQDKQDSPKNFILNNKMDKDMKMYLEYMSFHLEKLFKNFREDSLKEFKQSLYHFVDIHKNEKINFVERALAIGKLHDLSEEEIGYISWFCSNHKFIDNMEKLADSNYSKSKEELEDIEVDEGLSDEEILILEYIIDEKKKQKSQSEILNQPNNDNDNDKVNKANKNKDKIDLQKEAYKQIYVTKKETNQSNSPCEILNQPNNDNSNNKNKANENESKIDLQNETNQQISETKKETNQYDTIKADFDNDPKYQKLLSIINNMKENISSLEKTIIDLDIKYTNDISNMKKENEEKISKLNQDIERLNDIHKNIYFRDVSKFYIRQFAQTYKIDGESTFHICQNIMNSDFFKLNATNLKKIINKIVGHYLNGNKFSHMEYFISRSKLGIKKKLANEIENSYAEFMQFNDNEKNELINKFKIIKAPFIYQHKFK